MPIELLHTQLCSFPAVARGSLDPCRASFGFQSPLPPHDLVLAVPCCALTGSDNQLVPEADLHVGSMTLRRLWSQSRTLGNIRGVRAFNSLFSFFVFFQFFSMSFQLHPYRRQDRTACAVRMRQYVQYERMCSW